ncbi:MAG: hypothetical protein H3C52_11000 [Anaerolineales bacterium]|nr:hypothetical protein [Anaerolineales bacterium]
MAASISWYLASSLLGWLTFPLVFRLFPALTDRGYTLARAAGLLLWGWLFWILASLGVLRNDLGGLLFAFVLLLAISLAPFITQYAARNTNLQSPVTDLRSWLSSHKPLVIATELLFLVSFAFLAFVRACNPEAVGTEKPMELAFINAILRSPTFPPNDPWMSGYSISYYHFGYIMAAMLARVTATSGNLAFNLMSALVFALAAVGSYGILYNLLAAYTGRRVHAYTSTQVDTPDTDQSPITNYHLLALLAPLFLLILSNLEGLLEIFYKQGWFWTQNGSSFWTWLNIKELDQPPALLPGSIWERLGFWFNQQGIRGIGNWATEQFVPDRFWLWWWRASRVVSDFTLTGEFKEVIDEFPAFSFVLGDLHPHILALPFNFLGFGVALNLFLDGWRGAVNFFEFKLRVAPRDLLFAALVLGGLAFLNTWDILPAAALIVGAYVLRRVHDDGWSWSRLEDALLLGLPLGVAAVVLYLPFYLGFSSQAGGLLPNLVYPTRGAQLWVMWGTLLLLLFPYLIWTARGREARPRFGAALAWTFGLVLFLWAFSWLMGLGAEWLRPEIAAQFLAQQGQPDAASLFRAAALRRLSYIGALVTIAAVFWLALSHLLTEDRRPMTEDAQLPTANSQPSSVLRLPSSVFVFLLILLGSLLILAPDFVYLSDGFGYRINTIFKFYYQAWQLWSLAAAFGTAVLLRNLRGVWSAAWRILLGLVLFVGLIYPVLAFLNKTSNFHPSNGYSLDASAHLDLYDPEDAAAIRYLQSAPLGVVAEAIGGSYSNYARIATYTGLPTVLGWPWHEFQWRGNWDAHGSRESDIKTLYEVPDWETAQTIIDRYQIRYIVVGGIERTTYNVSEIKFQQHLAALFQAGSTVIYGVP